MYVVTSPRPRRSRQNRGNRPRVGMRLLAREHDMPPPRERRVSEDSGLAKDQSTIISWGY